MTSRTMKALALGLALALTGCAYTFHTTLPDHVQSLRVSSFQNDTLEVGLEAELTDQLIQAFASDGRIQVSDAQPDAIVEGKIRSYSRQALSYGSDDGIYQFRMILVADFSCKDLQTGEYIAGPKSVKQTLDHQVFGSLASSERDAQKEIAQELAKEIVHEVLMAW